MGFFSKCIQPRQQDAVDAHWEAMQKREAQKKALAIISNMKVPVTDKIKNGWPDLCTICHAGCMNQICNSCKPLFERGLRVKDPYQNRTLSVDGMRLAVREFVDKNGRMPAMINMHPIGYSKYERDSRRMGFRNDMYLIEGITVRLRLETPQEGFTFD